MGDNDARPAGWISRIGAWRGSRRQTGTLGALLLTAFAAPDSALGRGRKRRPARADQNHRARANARRRCGGISGRPCPRGFTCSDDPGDDCAPESGGADCGGICVRKRRNPCARIRCAEGTVCCPRCGGLCLPLDIPCSGDLCVRQPCNEAVCGPGEYCCNASCSRCVPLGSGCTDEVCAPNNEPCGQTVCVEGSYCCAAQCSLCLPRGETCYDALCPHQPDGVPCGQNVCGEGEYCCNPSCGTCARLDESCHQAICDPVDPPLAECGRVACSAGQVCCNASCGVCTPPGGACSMIACVEEPVR